MDSSCSACDRLGQCTDHSYVSVDKVRRTYYTETVIVNMMSMSAQRIFSGTQPSGDLHLGNYLGAIKNWTALQDAGEAIFCIVDLHAITVSQDPAQLRRRTLDVARVYLASGIDPARSTVFVQSHVAAHAELGWILTTMAGMGELEKMTQYKDKTAKSEHAHIGVGLFTYPVLMAADILLYDAAQVPVGEDQTQHVELARDLAKRFNHRFGETFVVPEALIKKEGMRIMGLDDPHKKMSKSAASVYNYIALSDDAATITKKIRKAVTDSGSEIVFRADKPALANLITIYAVLTDMTPQDVEKKFAGQQYGVFKDALADVAVQTIVPLQERMAAWSDDQVEALLRDGAVRAREIADVKMRIVREKMGMVAV